MIRHTKADRQVRYKLRLNAVQSGITFEAFSSTFWLCTTYLHCRLIPDFGSFRALLPAKSLRQTAVFREKQSRGSLLLLLSSQMQKRRYDLGILQRVQPSVKTSHLRELASESSLAQCSNIIKIKQQASAEGITRQTEKRGYALVLLW